MIDLKSLHSFDYVYTIDIEEGLLTGIYTVKTYSVLNVYTNHFTAYEVDLNKQKIVVSDFSTGTDLNNHNDYFFEHTAEFKIHTYALDEVYSNVDSLLKAVKEKLGKALCPDDEFII